MPRTLRHWTPRYVVNRLAVAYHQRIAPNDPWLTKPACTFLDDWLTGSDVGLEWGCGRSTLWFADRVQHLTSVEHNPHWHALVAARLAARGVTNVDLRLCPVDPRNADDYQPYIGVGLEFERSSLDFVLVDGQLRGRCAELALTLLKPGGILIIDNAEWFIPHPSHSPGAIARRTKAIAAEWRGVVDALQGWRRLWTSNGVWDTAIYGRPARQTPLAS
jgi:hypothetical protein